MYLWLSLFVCGVFRLLPLQRLRRCRHLGAYSRSEELNERPYVSYEALDAAGAERPQVFTFRIMVSQTNRRQTLFSFSPCLAQSLYDALHTSKHPLYTRPYICVYMSVYSYTQDVIGLSLRVRMFPCIDR